MIIRIRKLDQKGYTLIELAIATVIMAVMATTVIMANNFANKQSVANQDSTFATEKAIQMYEELRSLVNGNEQLGAAVLDNYSNFSTYSNVLTTDKDVDTGLSTANPGDPLSGNFKSDGYWRYMRQVEVNLVANDSQARQVTVKVYRYPGNYVSQASPGPLLATVGGILRTSIQPNVPTQVYDIYVLQINNIPSWWSVLPTLAGYMQSSVSDLESRLRGIDLRVHYITRTSYGRDYYYQPETNSFSSPSESNHQQWVYFYPGDTPQDGTAGDFWYYDPQTSGDPNSLLMTGNFLVDGTSYPVSTSQFNNLASASYSVADQYNNAMRYPDELAAYQAVTIAAAATKAAGGVVQEGTTEISERMLFEGMLSQPASFSNAMIINLHGELLPLPPMRNYSDAAKDPGNQLGNVTSPGPQTACGIPAANGVTGDTNVRVVTHPELLYYPAAPSTSSSVTVRLRVYAYYDSEDVGGPNNLPVSDPRVPAISLFFPDAAVTLVGVTAEIGNNITGARGVTYARVAMASPYTGAVAGDATAVSATGSMAVSFSYVGTQGHQTLIGLYNTPLRCPTGPVSGGSGSATFGGLNSGDILYGSEYIPCAPDASSAPTSAAYAANSYTFTSEDLASPDTNTAGNPCNTARWIISVAMPITQAYTSAITFNNQPYNNQVIDASGTTVIGQHIIETYIGNAVTTIPSYTVGANTTTIYPDMSRTYVWCGSTMPPYTEQYQFTGDPRDCPYLDVKAGGLSITGAAITIGPNAYNWWFKGTGTAGMATDGYVGFGQAGTSIWSGNGGGNLNVDLPRYYQLIRQGLLKTTSIWTNTNGWSWFYYGMGGEYGSDQGPRSNGIIMYDDLFKTSAAGAVTAGIGAIYQGDNVLGSHGSGLFVTSNVTGSNSVTWYQRSWLGEIYPDKSYGNWVTYGNLPSVQNTTIAAANRPDTFYLEPMSKVKTTGSGSSDDGYAGVTFWPNPAGYGSESFFGGKNTTTNKTLEHQSTDANGTELQLAVTTYNIYPFPLPSVVDINREWDFGGGTTPESAFAPYNSAGMTTTLSIPSVTSHNGSDGVTSRLFYSWSSATTQYGAAVVQMNQVSSGTTQVGYVIENGSAPSTAIGAQTLAETSLVLAMRTFLDGGQMAATNAPGHIPQLPLIKIFLAQAVPQYNENQGISFTVACPVTATTAGGGAVSVGMPVTDIWWAYNPNGLASYYTEEYPQYSLSGGLTMETGNYQEAATVVYNVKYSGDGGQTWYYAQDPQDTANKAVSGIYSAAYAVTNVAPWTYNLPVTAAGYSLPEGSYKLMVEAYRQNYGLHYCYDVQNFTVSY